MIYKFINPSDEITFIAPSDQIAFCCSVIIGGGYAGCENTETGESINAMIAFSSDPQGEIKEFLGSDIFDYVKANEISVADCFSSFAYVSAEEREAFDAEFSKLKPNEIETFRREHDRDNRMSMNKFVVKAWEYSTKKAGAK
ncbi:hypothetical protein [uncultured Chryseobacterium sp.]|uniref:hypothetical protein n=1 Tax=uncultured Chryseobacterium sp. TaxID=259322 RepID=UPI0025D5275D|nr:hypothetical protein [uncultured Chryseobacterium sp.]